MESPIERMKRKIMKENLWFFILKILEKNEKYGKEIRENVKKEYGFWVGNVTAYKVLYRLDKGGYVDFYDKGRRRYYKITSKGKNEVKDAKKFLKSL